MSARARSAAFLLVFSLGTVVAVLAAVPVAILSARAMRGHALGWARFHRWCARRLLGVCTSVEGKVPSGPALIACKHQSMFETLELVVILGSPAAVVKAELARIPVFGPVARRYGVVPIDRGRSAGALRRMLAAAQRATADGRQIMIFPEGTRVAPGEAPPLKPGFAGLYARLGLPVIPVAVDSGRLYPRRGWVRRAGVVRMRFGEPVPPGLPRREAEARVHAAINALQGAHPIDR